jgi:hypothetical protein
MDRTALPVSLRATLEAYFSFSYGPIFVEGGQVGGVFRPVIETTERSSANGVLRTLRDRAAGCKGVASSNVGTIRPVAASNLVSRYGFPSAVLHPDRMGGGACLSARWHDPCGSARFVRCGSFR